MGLICINGACQGALQAGFTFGFGTNTAEKLSQYISLPYSGYIKYISISSNNTSGVERYFNYVNATTATTVNDIILLDADQTHIYKTFDVGELTFSAQDIFNISSSFDEAITEVVYNIVIGCELTGTPSNLISLTGAIVPGTFINAQRPYKYGTNTSFPSGSGVIMRIPVNCQLAGFSYTANQDLVTGAPDVVPLNIYKNGISQFGLNLPQNGFSVGSAGINISYSAGDTFQLVCGGNVASLNCSIATAVFEVL